MRLKSAILLSLFFAIYSLSVAAQTGMVGSLSGQASKDASGGFNYSVPITVPVGVAGIQPQISFVYNSQNMSTDGILGLGWSLQGANSRITRCAKTVIEDAVAAPVDFDSNDQLCLNGARLISISGTYGLDGAEYRTRNDGFSKIISYGVSGVGESSFPAYFKVWTKEGHILEFGNSEDSRVEQQGRTDGAVIQWSVNKVSDRYSNYMDYKYIENTLNGSYFLDQINYTGNSISGVLPQQQVKFLYESSSANLGYFSGGLLTSNQRLKTITTLSKNTTLYTYTVSYTPISAASNNFAHPLVASIQQCAGAKCFYPIEFSWVQNAYSLARMGDEYDMKTSVISALPEGSVNNPTLFGDINGDGYIDTVWADLAWKVSPPQVKISSGLGKGDGTFNTAVLQKVNIAPAGIWNESTYLVDGDADGKADIIYISSATPTGSSSYNKKFSIYFSKSYGNGDFAPFSVGAYQDVTLSPSSSDWRNFIADINGDGLIDGLWVRSYGSGLATCFSLNKGNGVFDQTIKCNTLTNVTFSSSEWVDIVDDVNKDGYVDIVIAKSNAGLQAVTYLGKGDGTFTYTITNTLKSSGYTSTEWKELFGDINGDGYSDLVWMKSDSTGLQADIAYSKGNGSFVMANSATLTLSTADYSANTFSDRIGDINGDGKADLVWLSSGLAGLQAAVAINRGNASFLAQPLITLTSGRFDDAGITKNGIYTTYAGVEDIVADVTGDAVADIVFGYHGAGDVLTFRTAGLVAHVFKSLAQAPKVIKVKDALGNTTEASYSPMTNTNVYRKGGSAVYPAVDSVFSFQYLLSELKTSNGAGGFNVTQFKYADKKTDWRGADLGFAQIETNNISGGLKIIENYSQDYANKKQGTLIRSRVYSSYSGNLLSDTNNVWETKFLNSNATYYSYVKSSTVATCDLAVINNGVCDAANAISRKIATNTYDDFGNLTNEQVVNYDDLGAYTKTNVNQYTNIVSDWLIGQITNSVITSQAPSQPDIIRTQVFDYNSAGMISNVIIEPNQAQLWRKKHYEYNQFGEVSSVVDSWPQNSTQLNFSSSTTVDLFDPTGRFKKTSKNALNQSQLFEYDEVKGTLLSTTDANGLKTSWDSDEFGRQIKEARADGTSTTTEYAWCDPITNACPINGAYTITRRTCSAGVIVCDAATPNSNAIAPTVEYYDALNRLIRKKIPGIYVKNTIQQDTQYDALGRVAKTSIPYYVNDSIVDTVYWIVNEYDQLDRQTKITNADNSFKTIKYNGLTTIVTNELNQINKYRKNSLGLLVSVEDNATNKIFYTYDSLANLTKTQDVKNNITTMSYDLLGNKTAMNDPDLGSWKYEYNGMGLLAKQIDNKGVISKTSYDVLGRITSRSDDVSAIAGATQNSTWKYDTQPKGIGKLATINSPGFVQTTNYDVFGRVGSTVSSVNAGGAIGSYTFSNTYDAFSRVLTTTYPTNYKTTNKWNAQGYVDEVDGPNGFILKQVGSIDVFGKEDDVLFGNGVENIRRTDKKTGRMTSLQARVGATDLINQSYQFDVVGNLNQRKDTKQKTQEDFLYDGLNRLTSSQNTQTSAGDIISNTSVEYDELGNIRYKSDVGNYAYNVSCGASNIAGPHAVSSLSGFKNTGYCYDKNGNMISGDGRAISYWSFNKPAVIDKGNNHVAMYYDVNYQLLVRKDTVNGDVTTTTMLGAYEKIESSSGIAHKLYIGDFAVVTQASGKPDNINYLHKDHLDSVMGISNQSGALAESFSFDAWGKRRHVDMSAALDEIDYISLTSQITNKGFTGHQQLDSVGLIHMGGRVYDPTIGRFLSADPFIQAPDNMQSYNRYSYVMNNPLSLTDPTGYFWAEIGSGVNNFFGMISNLFMLAINSVRNTIRSLMRGVYKMAGQDTAYRGMTQNNQLNASNQMASCGSSITCAADASGIGVNSRGFGSGSSSEQMCATNETQSCGGASGRAGGVASLLPQNQTETASVNGQDMKVESNKINIDFDFIAKLEGGMKTKGYVPNPSESKSGVTVSVGFDLGARNMSDIKSLGLSDSLIGKLEPYLGKQGMMAKSFLDSNPLTISEQEASTIYNNVKNKMVNNLVKKYNGDSAIAFNDIPSKWQTVIGSVEFQYGSSKKKAPIYWGMVTHQNWGGALGELRNFGDNYATRRNKEANYAQGF